MTVRQSLWKNNGGTVMVEQELWNSNGGTVMVEHHSGIVIVEQSK